MVRRAFAYLTVVVALAALLVTGLVAGCRLFRGEETPVPGSATPGLETMLRLEPASGSPGTIFTVTGEGWPANKIVSLYVGYSLKEALDAKPWGDFVIDGNGRFSTKLSAPVLNVWDRGLDWFVVARLKGGKLDASTVFSIPDPRPGAATATPSPVATTPSSQPTRLEGAVEGIDLQGRLLLVKATDAKTYLFNIAREAVIIAVDGRPLLLSDVQLGTRVVAEGLLKPNGSVDVSRLIITQPSASPTPGQMPTATVVANPSEPNLRVDSIIESIALEARLLTCRDTAGKVLRVNVPPEATILASDGRPLTIGDLRLGYRVVLEGWSNADGSVTASRMIVDAGGLGPTATVTPTPAVVGGWEGTYYNNDSLLGQPALLRMDADLNFDWGANAPAEGIGADRFSARWTKSLTFKSGGYRFRVRADDGVRLWVDGDLLIDEWHDSSATTYEREVYLAAGQHTVRVDYYEAEGEALIQVRWDAVTEFRTGKASTLTTPTWRATRRWCATIAPSTFAGRKALPPQASARTGSPCGGGACCLSPRGPIASSPMPTTACASGSPATRCSTNGAIFRRWSTSSTWRWRSSPTRSSWSTMKAVGWPRCTFGGSYCRISRLPPPLRPPRAARRPLWRRRR